MHDGGGFVGVGEPSAFLKNGRFFQLAHVLGVEKELGYSLSTDKYFTDIRKGHFINQSSQALEVGEGMKNIYAIDDKTQILQMHDDSVELSSHDFGKGRGVYLAGVPYSPENSSLFLRAVYYAAHKEKELYHWYSENPNVEVHYYPEKKRYCVVNNTDETQVATIYLANNKQEEMTLEAGELVWRSEHE